MNVMTAASPPRYPWQSLVTVSAPQQDATPWGTVAHAAWPEQCANINQYTHRRYPHSSICSNLMMQE